MRAQSDDIQVRCATSSGGIALHTQRTALTTKRPVLLVLHEAIINGAPPSVWSEQIPSCDVVHACSTDRDRYASAADIEGFARALAIAADINFPSRRIVVMGESMMAAAALALADGSAAQIRGAVAWDPSLNSSGAFAYRGSWLEDALATGRLGTFMRDLLGKRHDRLSGAKLTRRVLRETQAPVLVLLREVVPGQALSIEEIIEAISTPADRTDERAILTNVAWHHLEGYDRTSFYQPSRASVTRIADFILDVIATVVETVPDKAARAAASSG